MSNPDVRLARAVSLLRLDGQVPRRNATSCGALLQTNGTTERFLFRPRRVCMVEDGSCGRGSLLMECSLDQALQGTPAILAKVRPEDLGGPTLCASWVVRASSLASSR